jgi:hypothetical protein
MNMNEQQIEMKAEDILSRYNNVEWSGEGDSLYTANQMFHAIVTALKEGAAPVGEAPKWTTEKPELNQECLLLTANFIKHAKYPECSYWSYRLFEITKIESDEGWYWGILDEGIEWGAIEDVKADLYQIVATPKPQTNA